MIYMAHVIKSCIFLQHMRLSYEPQAGMAPMAGALMECDGARVLRLCVVILAKFPEPQLWACCIIVKLQ